MKRTDHARMQRFFLLLTGCLSLIVPARSQDNRFLPLDDPAYEYISRLQRRGLLLELDPTLLPYRRAAVTAALQALDDEDLAPVQRRWVARLNAAFAPVSPDAGEVLFGVETGGGATAANTVRLDVLRPIREDLHVFEHVLFRAYLTRGAFVGQMGMRHDLYYDRDPDGLDAVNRLMARGEESYLGARGRFAALYLGRFGNHWGVYRQAATLVSANPRSYDQLSLRLGGARFSLNSIVGELDSITSDGRYTGTAGDDSVAVGSERRFLSAHRFNWRPSRHFSLAIMESALYSGAGSGFSLKYLNPLLPALFSVDNRPKNDENNGFFGGLFWAHLRRLTLQGQLMIDDFDALNGREPTSFALTGHLTYALSPTVDLGGSLEMVASRTYNTFQPEGRYLYLLRGLATQFSDYVAGSAFADLYLDRWVSGLQLTPQLRYLAQGERDIRQPFPEKDAPVPSILTGTVTHTWRTALEFFYQDDSRWWLRADLGFNHVVNADAVPGRSATRFSGMVELGLRLSLQRALQMGF